MPGYPCCCNAGYTFTCGAALVTGSGVANSSCSNCGSQFNNSTMTSSGSGPYGPGGGFGSWCGTSIDYIHCQWQWEHSSAPCFDEDGANFIIMFADSSGNKYVGVSIFDNTIGGFGADVAFWKKSISDYTGPITIGPSDLCSDSSSKCDFSAAEWTISQ